jgi:lysophospholipase L1-like esterase
VGRTQRRRPRKDRRQPRGSRGGSTEVLASQVTPALAANPKVIYLIVGTNDTSLGLTLAQSISNFTAIFAAFAAARVPVIVVNVPPNNNGFQAATGKLNAWLARYCRENTGFGLADVFSAVVDTTTGNFATA